jgi:hypothetical protein
MTASIDAYQRAGRGKTKNAAILEDRGVSLAHGGENSRGLPHTPSLELSVLPNGGGQCIELLAGHSAIAAPTHSRTEWS